MKKFTQYGLTCIYGDGDTSILSPSDGGIFAHCRLGSTISEHHKDFSSMENAIALTSILRKCVIRYIDGDLCTTYAKVKLIYDFNDEHIGDINEIILTKHPMNDGALYHHVLEHPIRADGKPFSIEVNLEFPIIPYDMVLAKRKNFTAIGKIHEIVDGELKNTLPSDFGEMVVDGNDISHSFNTMEEFTVIGTPPRKFTLNTRVR